MLPLSDLRGTWIEDSLSQRASIRVLFLGCANGCASVGWRACLLRTNSVMLAPASARLSLLTPCVSAAESIRVSVVQHYVAASFYSVLRFKYQGSVPGRICMLRGLATFVTTEIVGKRIIRMPPCSVHHQLFNTIEVTHLFS